MIWYLTNVDTEILALRVAVEALPDGFPPVRAAQPWSYDDRAGPRRRALRGRAAARGPASLGGRLRRAARRVHRAGHPAAGLRRRGRARRRADRAVDRAERDRHRRVRLPGQRRAAELRATCCASWPTRCCSRASASTPPSRSPPTACGGRASASADRPRIGVVFYRAHLVAGNTQFVTDLCDAIEAGGAEARGRVVLLAAGRRGAAASSSCWPNGDVDVAHHHRAGDGRRGGRRGRPGRGRRAATATSGSVARWPRSACPILQAPSSGQSDRRVAGQRRPGLGPLRRHRRGGHPGVRRADHRPGLRLQGGGRRRRRARRHRCGPTAPCPTGSGPRRRPRAAPRPPAPDPARRQAGGDRAQRLPHQAQPARQRRRPRHAGQPPCACSTRWPRPATTWATPPADGDELMARAGRRPHLRRRVAHTGAAGHAPWAAWTSPTTAGGSPRCPPTPAGSWSGPGARRRAARVHDGELVFSGLDLGQRRSSPSSRRGATATTRSPSTTRPTCPRPTTTWPSTAGWTRSGAPTPSSTSASTAPSSGCPARRWPCPPAAGPTPPSATCRSSTPSSSTIPARAPRPSGAPTPSSSTTCCPPMTRADTYDEMARLEQLFDEYSQLQSLDPSKLPALRDRIWETCSPRPPSTGTSGLGDAPDDDGFDDLIVDVDGYLCSLKDAQIRGGLHTLGRPPQGDDAHRPGARHHPAAATGRCRRCGAAVAERARPRPRRPAARSTPSRLVAASSSRRGRATAGGPGRDALPTAAVGLRLAGARTWPERPTRSTTCWPAWPGATCRPGRAGARPAAAPTCCRRAATSTRSTRRRCPRRCRWDVGPPAGRRAWSSGTSRETGGYPRTVGLVLWGTALHADPGRRRGPGAGPAGRPARLAGRVPAGRRASRRSRWPSWAGPRVDVTLRISGFFRDAFPHLVAPGRRGGRRWSPPSTSRPSRTPCGPAAPATPGSTARPRAPTASGIRHALEQRSWRSDDDLAAMYIGVVGLLLRARRLRRPQRGRHAPAVRGHRCRGEEPGQPRARHLRQRRLPRRSTAGWSPPSAP